MGEDDDNDAAVYGDAYDDSEREIINKILGEKMLPDRWNTCTEYYHEERINAEVKLYRNTGHEITREIQNDILSFMNTALKNN